MISMIPLQGEATRRPGASARQTYLERDRGVRVPKAIFCPIFGVEAAEQTIVNASDAELDEKFLDASTNGKPKVSFDCASSTSIPDRKPLVQTVGTQTVDQELL